MSVKTRLTVLAIGCIGLTVSAAAQLGSSDLRAKYGLPLNRETFRMPVGFDLIVDYSPSGQVCKLEVPALMPSNEKVRNSSVMKQRMYDFLSDLVPASLRGKELRRSMMAAGAVSASAVDYEQVVVNELQHTGDPFGNESANCQEPASK